jgi:uncharacterized membrane protein
MDHIQKIREETKKIKAEIKTSTIGYILAALGLVAGLAWNDAIKTLIESLFPLSQNSIKVKFIYAAAITVIVVLLSIYLARLAASGKEEKEELSKDK